MPDEIRIQPEVKSLVISKSPKLEIMWLAAKRGQVSSLQIQSHAYAAVKRPATSIRRVNLGPQTKVEWHGMSTGFIPAGWKLDAEITSTYEATALIIDEAFFMASANENLRYRPELFHAITGGQSNIGNMLVTSLSNVTEIEDWPLLAENIASSLATHLMHYFSGGKRGRKDPYPPALPRERMRRVVAFIEDNIHRVIHLNELANVAALSTFHFSRSFTHAMGVTPVRYVWRRRVERSRILLRNRDIPISIIALDCGFSSQSHFTTVFKRETGITPGQYRAQID